MNRIGEVNRYRNMVSDFSVNESELIRQYELVKGLFVGEPFLETFELFVSSMNDYRSAKNVAEKANKIFLGKLEKIKD